MRKTTAAEKKLNGDYRPSRDHEAKLEIDENELVALTPPVGLCVIGKRQFKLWAELLFDLKRTTEADRNALALMARVWTDVKGLDNQIKKMGYLIERETAAGIIQQIANPLLTHRNAAHKTLISLYDRFGMTPASRAKVTGEHSTSPNDDTDPLS